MRIEKFMRKHQIAKRDAPTNETSKANLEKNLLLAKTIEILF